MTEAKAALQKEFLILEDQADEYKSGFELLSMEIDERNTDMLRVKAERDAIQVFLDIIKHAFGLNSCSIGVLSRQQLTSVQSF